MADNSFETIFSVEFEDFSSVKNKLESLKKKIGSSNTSGIKIDVDTTEINKIIENVNKLSKSNIQILPNGQIKAISTFNDEIGKTIKLTNDLATGRTKIDITEDYSKQEKVIQQQKEEIVNVNKLIELEKQKLQIKQKNIELNRGSLVDSQQSSTISTSINGLSGNTIKEVKENASKLNIELQKLDQNARMKGISVGQKNVQSLGDAFKSTASKLGIFVSTTMVIRQLGQEVKQATEYIIEMDKSLTNIMMITGKTSSQVSSIINEFKSLGTELHTTNKEIMNSSEEILRAGYDTETAKKMLEASVIGSKVSGQTSQQVTEQLIAIKNAFNMTGEELDGVIDKMATLDNTSATSFKELADATKNTAFSAQEMGTSFSDLLAYITTVSEKTRRAPETIGESFKTIYARYANIKLGNLDEDGKSINDVEKALGRLNIKLRDGEGSFRDFDVVLKEFMNLSNSGNISNIDKLAVVQALAGTRQKETLLALIENTDALSKHQEDLTNSTGMAKDMFDNAYSDSLDAKINDLKRSFEGLYESLLNSSTLKFGLDISTTTINGVAQLSKSLGTLPTIVTAVSASFLIFNKNAREIGSLLIKDIPIIGSLQGKINGLASSIKTQSDKIRSNINLQKAWDVNNKAIGVSTTGLGVRLTGLNIKLALTQAKMMAVKLAGFALSTALSIGLSLAIGAIISGVSKFVSSMRESETVLQDTAEQVTTLGESLKNIEVTNDLTTEYKKLNDELNNGNLTLEERNEIVGKIATTKESLTGIDGRIKTILDNSNLSLETQLSLIQEIAKEKAKEEAEQLNKDYTKNSWNGHDAETKAMNSRGDVERTVEYYQKLNKLQQEAQGGDVVFQNKTLNLEEQNAKLQELKDTLGSAYLGLTNFNQGVQSIKDANVKTSLSFVQLKDGVASTAESIINGTDKIKNSTANNSLENSLKSLGYTADDVKKKMNDLSGASIDEQSIAVVKEATQTYGELGKKIEETRELLSTISEDGYVSADMVEKLSATYPELGANINNTAKVQEFLNAKIQEQVSASQNAYSEMLLNDSNFYNDKIKNSTEFQNALQGMLNGMVTMSGEKYQVDLSNFATLQGLKNDLQNQFGDSTGKFLDSYLDILMTAYNFDSSQFADEQSMKEGNFIALCIKKLVQ